MAFHRGHSPPVVDQAGPAGVFAAAHAAYGDDGTLHGAAILGLDHMTGENAGRVVNAPAPRT
jgi:hypothetical protein